MVFISEYNQARKMSTGSGTVVPRGIFEFVRDSFEQGLKRITARLGYYSN